LADAPTGKLEERIPG